jgi:hypothetical protein
VQVKALPTLCEEIKMTTTLAPDDQEVNPSAATQTLERVKEVMKEVLGIEEIILDDDGDIPVRCGDVAVYVRVLDDPPVVRIFSPAVTGLESSAGIHQALNDINAKNAFVKVYSSDDTVIFSAELVAEPAPKEQLAVVFHLVATAAEKWAHELQARYGGRTRFGRALPPRTGLFAGYL